MIPAIITAFLIGVGILLSIKFLESDKTKKIGVGGSIGLPILFVSLIYGICYFTANYSTEYWAGFGNSVTMKEGYWTTTTTTDAKGNTTTTTTYTPPSYYITDVNRASASIDSSHYISLAQFWGHSPAHNSDSGWTYSYDWNGDVKKKVFVTTAHYFKNKTQNAGSLYKYGNLSKEESVGLYQRNPIQNGYQHNYTYGFNNPVFAWKLSDLNCRYGHNYQIIVNFLVFNNSDMDVAIKQEALWKGGAKNEFNICYGLNELGKVAWCKVFSWTEEESLKTEIQNYHEFGEDFNPDKVLEHLNQAIPAKWKRKEFKSFDYIATEYPSWCLPIMLLLDMIGVGVLLFFLVREDDKWNTGRFGISRRKPTFGFR